MDKKVKASSIWSATGLWLGMVLLACFTGGYQIFFNDVWIFLLGGFQEIRSNNLEFLMMIPLILAITSIELPLSLYGGILQHRVAGKTGAHSVDRWLDSLRKGNLFLEFFAITLAEEICARWFFLGILTKITALSGTFGFIFLFFVGNSLWSLVHLRNFKNKKDWHIIRVLPQFIGGIFYTYAFVKFGLMGAVLTHFASNSIAFALRKEHNTSKIDLMIILYSAILIAVSYYSMDKPISDIMIWFTNGANFSLKDWNFFDYIKISIFFTALSTLIFEILLFDSGAERELDVILKIVSEVGFLMTLLIIAGSILLFFYVLFGLLGLAIDSVPYRVLILSILLAFLKNDDSGSSVSRTFWTVLPLNYISICIIQALGFWLAIPYVLAQMIIMLPQGYFELKRI